MNKFEKRLIKKKILKCLTEDFENNKALYDKDKGYCIFSNTNLEMVMDKVVKGIKFAEIELNRIAF
jgi:uncharacterized membrane protein YbaN (DUF454 family)